jgi:hypothetical protein
MKTLIAFLIMSASAFAADAVTITIKQGSRTVEATVSVEAVAAMTAFVADQKKDDGTPKYPAGIPDLMISHFRESLAKVLIERYSEAIKALMAQADEAKKSADDAVTAAASGTVVVK